MKRWSKSEKRYVVRPKVDAFLKEVIGVCKKHGLSIGHEDGHGSFEIEPYSDEAVIWLNNAGVP